MKGVVLLKALCGLFLLLLKKWDLCEKILISIFREKNHDSNFSKNRAALLSSSSPSLKPALHPPTPISLCFLATSSTAFNVSFHPFLTGCFNASLHLLSTAIFRLFYSCASFLLIFYFSTTHLHQNTSISPPWRPLNRQVKSQTGVVGFFFTLMAYVYAAPIFCSCINHLSVCFTFYCKGLPGHLHVMKDLIIYFCWNSSLSFNLFFLFVSSTQNVWIQCFFNLILTLDPASW